MTDRHPGLPSLTITGKRHPIELSIVGREYLDDEPTPVLDTPMPPLPPEVGREPSYRMPRHWTE